MPIKFEPKKEEDLKRFSNLPPGLYPFTVLESEEVASKSTKNLGRMMCAVKLNVHGPKFDAHVYTYFADWFSEWLLKHFCETTGQGEAYAKGEVDASNNNWQGKQGWVKIGIEPASDKYKEKNVVDDFVVKDANAPVAAAPKIEPPFDNKDDVPF